jgi:hypothetical protein
MHDYAAKDSCALNPGAAAGNSFFSTRLLEHCLSCPQAMQKAVKRSGTLSGTCYTSSPSKCARAIKNPQTSHGTAQYVCFSVIPDAPCHLPSMMLLTVPSNRYSVYCKRRPGTNVPGKDLLWCVCFSDVGYLVFLLVCKRCSWFHSKFFPSCPDRQVQFLRAAHLSQPQGRYGAPVLTKLMVVMKIVWTEAPEISSGHIVLVFWSHARHDFTGGHPQAVFASGAQSRGLSLSYHFRSSILVLIHFSTDKGA